MFYKVVITRKAEKQLLEVPIYVQSAIDKKIQSLAHEPRPHGSIKLYGLSDYYRIRQGDYRIIYQIEDEIKMVSVVKIGHRREVYE